MIRSFSALVAIFQIALFTSLAAVSPTFPKNDYPVKSLQIDVSSTLNGWHLQLRSFRIHSFQEFGYDSFCDQKSIQKEENRTVRCSVPDIDLPEQEEGLSMTVVNERNGTVTLQKIFRTWEFWTHWANLLWYVKNVPSGRIVVFSFSGQGSIGLRHATPTLVALGSNLVPYLTQKNNWIWVFVKSGRTIFESSSLKRYPPLHASLNLSLLTSQKPVIVNSIDRLRWKICRGNELMGDFCEENNRRHDNIRPSINVTFENLKNIPIVVTAGSRPYYFYFSMKTLLETPGVQPSQIIVILGDKREVYFDLLKLFKIKYIVLNLYWSNNAKLFQYYRRVYEYVRATYPKSPAAIFLDEDVEVSPDFFFYMNQTVPFLQEDPSIYCVNSYSSVRSNQLAYDPTKVLRSIAQVAWGYAVSLNFINEALLQWSKVKVDALFDMWLLLHVSQGRECIFPEQTRTSHFGIDGVNFEATFTSESYSVFLPLLKSYGVKLTNIDKILLPDWRKEVANEIRSAKVLTGNPCSPDFLPKNETGTFVSFFYMKQIDEKHLGNFMASGICLGVWSLSYQGLHEGTYTLRPRNDTLLHMMGVPVSPLSYLKPSHVEPWDFNSLNDAQKMSVLDYKERLATQEVERYEKMPEKSSEAVRDLFN